MNIWSTKARAAVIPDPPAVEVAANVRRYQQICVSQAAYYSTLVGLFRHHYGEADLPEGLASRDAAAFDRATSALYEQLCVPQFDLPEITAAAYRLGLAHGTEDCPFCRADDPYEARVSDQLDAHLPFAA